jgi:hypothetical protein
MQEPSPFTEKPVAQVVQVVAVAQVAQFAVHTEDPQAVPVKKYPALQAIQ